MKKRILLVIVSFSLILLPLHQTSHAANITLNNTPAQIYFSPKGGCTEAIVNEISHAKSEIYVQAYSFTSVSIAKALVDAHKRGIKVEAILDKSQKKERYTSAAYSAEVAILIRRNPTLNSGGSRHPLIGAKRRWVFSPFS
jgi:phosphatidylserine/phosphatidylglycerophosphate/cardiolipin synthase-like enzyme